MWLLLSLDRSQVCYNLTALNDLDACVHNRLVTCNFRHLLLLSSLPITMIFFFLMLGQQFTMVLTRSFPSTGLSLWIRLPPPLRSSVLSTPLSLSLSRSP